MFKAKPLVDALFAIGIAQPRINPLFEYSPFGLYRPTVTYRDHRLHMRWAPHPL
jgi:hypothetical protein